MSDLDKIFPGGDLPPPVIARLLDAPVPPIEADDDDTAEIPIEEVDIARVDTYPPARERDITGPIRIFAPQLSTVGDLGEPPSMGYRADLPEVADPLDPADAEPELEIMPGENASPNDLIHALFRSMDTLTAAGERSDKQLEYHGKLLSKLGLLLEGMKSRQDEFLSQENTRRSDQFEAELQIRRADEEARANEEAKRDRRKGWDIWSRKQIERGFAGATWMSGLAAGLAIGTDTGRDVLIRAILAIFGGGP